MNSLNISKILFEDYNRLWLVDESHNRFGTVKDRRSQYILERAKESNVQKLVLITSGNAGFSLAKFAKEYAIKVFCIVDSSFEQSIKEKLESVSAVISLDLSQKIYSSHELIELVQEQNELVWDVTNGFEGGYEDLAREVLQKSPDVIIVPIGSGELFSAFHNVCNMKNSDVQIIGVTSKNTNKSFADKLTAMWTPYRSLIKSILSESRICIEADEDSIREAYQKASSIFSTEPSAAVVLIPLLRNLIDKNKKIYVLNTGRGMYD